MNPNLKIVFKRFLKENGIYQLWINNRSGSTYHPTLEDQFLDEVDFTGWIIGAFSWAYSKENFHFWKKVHLKWLDFININGEKIHGRNFN